MAEGTTAIDLELGTEGDADGTDLIEYGVGTGEHTAEGALQYISQHEEIAALKLAPAFWGKPFVVALLSSFMREIQALEDTLWEMLELRTVDGGDLPRLKVIGKLVGQPRLRFELEDYRLLIRARALANVSRGRASDMFGVLEVLLGPGQYTLVEGGEATLYLTALQPIDETGVALIAEVLPDTRSAGVGLQLFRPIDDSIAGLRWGSSVDTGLGGDLDSSVTPIVDTPLLYSVRNL